MPSESSHRRHRSHDSAGASRPQRVQISRPIEYGSQQQIRGPDHHKTLDQVRHEQGSDYNPLQQKRPSSVARMWQTIKRSLSRSQSRNSQAGGRPASGSDFRHSLKDMIFGVDEERGRGRTRRRSFDAPNQSESRGRDSRPKARRYVSQSNRNSNTLSQSNASVGPESSRSDVHAAELKRHRHHRSESKKHSSHHTAKNSITNKPERETFDPRKAVGPPYDEDITSSWWWNSTKGVWELAKEDGPFKYESLSARDYETITGRKRGVFPPKPRQRGPAKDSRSNLDTQVYYDKHSATYRALPVKATGAARPAVKEQRSSSRANSVRGDISFIQSQGEPVTAWPSGIEKRGTSVTDNEATIKPRTPRTPHMPIASSIYPEDEASTIRTPRGPIASSIYPEDEASKIYHASTSAPPMPNLPSQFQKAAAQAQAQGTYVPPRAGKEWKQQQQKAQQKPATPYAISKNNPFYQTTAKPTTKPTSSTFLQPGKSKIATAAGSETVWETDVPTCMQQTQGKTQMTWETDLPVHLTSAPSMEIPGLQSIEQSTLETDLNRLSWRRPVTPGAQPTEGSASANGRGGRSARRGTKVDTVCEIIDAYNGGAIKTKWEE